MNSDAVDGSLFPAVADALADPVTETVAETQMDALPTVAMESDEAGAYSDQSDLPAHSDANVDVVAESQPAMMPMAAARGGVVQMDADSQSPASPIAGSESHQLGETCPTNGAGSIPVAVGSEGPHPPTSEGPVPVNQPAVHSTGGASLSRVRPYGSWMLVTRKERGQPGRNLGSGQQRMAAGQTTVAGRNQGGATGRGSRFMPLESELEHDTQPGETSKELRLMRMIPRVVITAAEEDEHVVNRGEDGGNIINTTIVVTQDHEDHGLDAAVDHSQEHHTNPPVGFDGEGDIVMEDDMPQDPGLPEEATAPATHRPEILGIMEPKVSSAHANSICMKLGFSDWVRVEAVGFSGVLHQDETSNYSAFSAQRCSDFAEWIDNDGLVDMGFSGPKYTWSRGNEVGLSKSARLDRVLCNTEWRTAFSAANVVVGSCPYPLTGGSSNGYPANALVQVSGCVAN
nr:uncharacterized protein LOC109181278 [Ipomoea batatas]